MAFFDLEHFFARANFSQGQLALHEDLNNVGEVATRNMANQFAWMMNNSRQIEPGSYVSGTGKGDDLLVTDNTGGEVEVHAGVGWVLDLGTAAPGGAFDTDRYRPIVLADNLTLSLPVPTSFPRVDVVYAFPQKTLDESDGRSILPGPAPATLDLRAVWAAGVAIQAGTNGSPIPPSLPRLDAFELARVLWLTPSAYAVYDCRPVVELSEAAKAPPMGVLSNSFVLQTLDKPDTELKVTQVVPADMAVSVNAGIAVMSGRSFRVPFQTLQITAADPSDTRIDSVEINNATGQVGVVIGTPGAGAPALAFADSMRLALVEVPAAATSITGANITDLREINRYLSWDQMQAGQTIDDATVENSTLGGGLTSSAGVNDDIITFANEQTHAVTISALEFVPHTLGSNHENVANVGDGYVAADGTAAFGCFAIPLGWLPHGAILESINVLYSRENGSNLGSIELRIERGTFSTTAPGALTSINTEIESGGGAGNATLFADSPVQITGTTISGNGPYRFHAYVLLDNDSGGVENMRVYAAQIVYKTGSLAEALGAGAAT